MTGMCRPHCCAWPMHAVSLLLHRSTPPSKAEVHTALGALCLGLAWAHKPGGEAIASPLAAEDRAGETTSKLGDMTGLTGVHGFTLRCTGRNNAGVGICWLHLGKHRARDLHGLRLIVRLCCTMQEWPSTHVPCSLCHTALQDSRGTHHHASQSHLMGDWIRLW